jgi:lipopolysaccharide/colanic/teichoic acid biosynthesis glycosyltransferase
LRALSAGEAAAIIKMKRLFDLALVILSFPVWGPVMLVVALAVRVKLGSPVFFRQQRPGRGGKVFELVKFRSMLAANGPDGRPLPDAERLPPFGRALRASSLDELPELWNVLKGEMSLVGPRPLLVQYLPRYTPEQARRHEVRPGLTGLAQIKGRNAMTWEQKFAWDVRYVDERSLWLDIKILAATVWKVVRRDGISAAGEATMPEFNPQRAEQSGGETISR